jgi:hypothetical protein
VPQPEGTAAGGGARYRLNIAAAQPQPAA